MATNLTCTYFQKKICGSCDLFSLQSPPEISFYQSTLEFKEKALNLLFPDLPTEKIIPSQEVFGSRNKAKMSVSGTVDNPLIGYTDGFQVGRELLSCPLHQKDINTLLESLKLGITQYKLFPYQLKTRRGELKSIIIQQVPALGPKGGNGGELLLRFVVRSSESVRRIQKWVPHLQRQFPFLRVISVNIWPEHKAVLEGPEELILTTQENLWTQLGPYRLTLSPKAFFQTNSNVAIRLYSAVALEIEKIRPKLVLDLYCGVGPFSFFASAWAEKVIGVEISPQAIECARQSLIENKISNVEFYCHEVEGFFEKLKALLGRDNPQVVILNPPRAGLTEKMVEMLGELRIEHIIYSSCNPQTLKRDSERLKENFSLNSLMPFDMFPLTHHMEVVGIFKAHNRP